MVRVGAGPEKSEMFPGVVGQKDGETEVQRGLYRRAEADQDSCPLPCDLSRLALGQHQHLLDGRPHPEAWPGTEPSPGVREPLV